MKPVAQPALIKAFVQQTLGCGCPESVFSSLLTDTATPTGLKRPIRRLLIGSRLLIYLCESDTEQPMTRTLLDDLADSARKDRDENGYHRVRLVVVSTQIEQDKQELSAHFANRFGGDERMHLHVLERRECPDITDGKSGP